MAIVRAVGSNVTFLRRMVGAGWDGIATTRRDTGGVFTPNLQRMVWAPAAIGAAAGILSSRLIDSRKSWARTVLIGAIGAMAGSGAAMAWASRHFVKPAARNAARQISATRDAHWLASNPIDYA